MFKVNLLIFLFLNLFIWIILNSLKKQSKWKRFNKNIKKKKKKQYKNFYKNKCKMITLQKRKEKELEKS